MSSATLLTHAVPRVPPVASLQAHGPALPPLEHGVELTSGLVAQLSSGKELPQYHAMNALLKQLHMERLQRLVAHEAAAAHARRASDPH